MGTERNVLSRFLVHCISLVYPGTEYTTGARQNGARTGAMWQWHLPNGPGLDWSKTRRAGRKGRLQLPPPLWGTRDAHKPPEQKVQGGPGGAPRWTSTEKGPFISLLSLRRQGDNAPMPSRCCTALDGHHIAISRIFSSRIQQCPAFVFDRGPATAPCCVARRETYRVRPEPLSLINWMIPRHSARPVSYRPDWLRFQSTKPNNQARKKKEKKI